MVLLAAMPLKHRKKFIDNYFSCTNAPHLEKLLEDTVGEVDDDFVENDPILSKLLTHVRQERFTEELDKLNSNQRQVCEADYSTNMLVNAGPGSGKTHVLMMRCAHLIHKQKVDPSTILILAFNRTVVHEIRERIRKLFQELGYSSYASRVDVTTFHSFAMRFQEPSDQLEYDSVNNAVHDFAESIRKDTNFARSIGSKYRSILVDEFQDMNEDFFDVVTALITNCNGGGMVIGDDDQDILTWNRVGLAKSHGIESPLEAVHYFNRFQEDLEPFKVTLTVNYRSTPQVVDRSRRMIERAAVQLGFSRMKSKGELQAFRKDSGSVEIPVSRDDVFNLVTDAINNKKHVAVLCRSNRECREFYKTLSHRQLVNEAQIEILGSQDFPLYQLRASGGLLDLCHRRNNYEFVEKHIWSEMIEEFQAMGYADMPANLEFLDIIYKLVHSEAGRPRVSDFIDFIHEMRESDIQRLQPKVGVKAQQSRLTIATVHKVKGLEYDTVIAFPSEENFPFSTDYTGTDLSDFASEEARLYYVAMTRAKDKFYGGWGQREQSWWSKDQKKTNLARSHYMLQGEVGEVWVSLPGYERNVDEGWQEYIATQVSVGDPLYLNGRQFTHEGKPVGVLSTKAFDKIKSAGATRHLKVANVIRYRAGAYFRKKNPGFYKELHEDIQSQGWLYTVLVEEA